MEREVRNADLAVVCRAKPPSLPRQQHNANHLRSTHTSTPRYSVVVCGRPRGL